MADTPTAVKANLFDVDIGKMTVTAVGDGQASIFEKMAAPLGTFGDSGKAIVVGAGLWALVPFAVLAGACVVATAKFTQGVYLPMKRAKYDAMVLGATVQNQLPSPDDSKKVS